MTSKRVLHVNDYSPHSLGGAEVVMSRTVALLRERGWECETFTCDNLPDPRLTAIRYIDNAAARAAFRVAIRKFAPDIVHLHNFYHLLSPGILRELRAIKRQRPLRVVMTAHDYHLVCPNAGGTWFLRGEPVPVDFAACRRLTYLIRRSWDHRSRGHATLKLVQHLWNYRFCRLAGSIDLVICPSRFLQSAVGRLGVPTIWVPNASPAGSLEKVPRASELTLAFAGRLEPEKGIVRFVEMLPATFSARLVIMGDGIDRPRLEQVVRERNWEDRVTLTGRLPHAEAIRQIATAHVLVLPSRWDENYPLSLAEALAMGTNILVTDRGGMREIVLDFGVGYRFQQDNPTSLQDQLRQIDHDFGNGCLNSFDVSSVLMSRQESHYVTAIEKAYLGTC